MITVAGLELLLWLSLSLTFLQLHIQRAKIEIKLSSIFVGNNKSLKHFIRFRVVCVCEMSSSFLTDALFKINLLLSEAVRAGRRRRRRGIEKEAEERNERDKDEAGEKERKINETVN